MDAHKLQVILQKHQAWLNNEKGGECADLRSADLSYANLSSADLRYADLRYADLRYADLRYADLRSANLSYADLRSAYLSSADLSSADLRSAYLSSADLSDMQKAQTQIVPQSGQFTAYKKLRGGIAKLQITSKAKRSNAPGGRKCRSSEAKVISFIGTKEKELRSSHDNNFIYRVGEMVRPEKPFDEDWTQECTSGIHFFLYLEEAQDY